MTDKEIPSKSIFSVRKNFAEICGRQRSNSASESDHSVEAYMLRSKKAAGYLRQILHSQRCYGQCQVLICIQTSRILRHVPSCEEAICSTAGCDTTKKLLLHFDQCRSRAAFKSANPAQSQCLICSIACSSSPTKQLMVPSSGQTVSAHRSPAHVPQHQQQDYEVMQEDDCEEAEMSFSSDEVMEFNRIPFQNSHQQPSRSKTYSDYSEFVVPTGAPRGSANKARSKSMNAATVEELSSL